MARSRPPLKLPPGSSPDDLNPARAPGRRAHRLVRSTDLTAGQGTIVSLGSLAGTLVGLGVVALTGTDSGTAYLTGASDGSIGGYILTMRSVGQ